jgi:hypothetical protein
MEQVFDVKNAITASFDKLNFIIESFNETAIEPVFKLT